MNEKFKIEINDVIFKNIKENDKICHSIQTLCSLGIVFSYSWFRNILKTEIKNPAEYIKNFLMCEEFVV